MQSAKCQIFINSVKLELIIETKSFEYQIF